jgi:hypothetical protein
MRPRQPLRDRVKSARVRRPRRPVLLALAWLPCVLCAAAWVASYRWAFGAFGDGYYVWAQRGALYGTFAAKDIHDTWEPSAKPVSDANSTVESSPACPSTAGRRFASCTLSRARTSRRFAFP